MLGMLHPSQLVLEAVSKLVVGAQLIEQRLRLLQIARVEAFSEPPVNRSKAVRALAAPCPGRVRGARGSSPRAAPEICLPFPREGVARVAWDVLNDYFGI